MNKFSYFEIFKNRYFINAEIILQTPLHVGKGVSLKPIGTDLPVIKDAFDRPYIPGSSLKGVIRFQTERMLRSIEKFKDKFGVEIMACDPLGDQCVNDEKRKKIKKELKEKYTKNGKFDEKTFEEAFLAEIWNNTCLACRIFGSQWFASRIYFKDAYLLNEGNFYKTEIRDGVAIDRDTGTAKSKMKYDYEVVPPGVKFKFEIILENMQDWEVGLICLVLKLWKEGQIAIGGKTSVGLGWGSLDKIRIEKIDLNKLVDFIFDPSKKDVLNFEDLLNVFKTKLEDQKNAQIQT